VQFSWKLLDLAGKLLGSITAKFSFTEIFIFLLALGLAIAIFLPILFRS
jgi:hypothetical protein